MGRRRDCCRWRRTLMAWAVVVLGPLVALAAYALLRIVRHTTDRKVPAGIAATVVLLWFVGTADFLPPAWKSFWNTHSITAGVISSALLVGVGWLGIDIRHEHRRTSALYANWSNWLSGQERVVGEAIRTIRGRRASELAPAHASIAAGVRAGLAHEQVWAASAYTVFLLRPLNLAEQRLADALIVMRKHAGAAVTQLAAFEALLSQFGQHEVPESAASSQWEPILVHLENLLADIESQRRLVDGARLTTAATFQGRN